ncbi:glycosyltransferase [Modestobacter sp. VKM Ac-2983]|uniref:glycosyltransferase n=1 Tax=Modestobacter sp. VKM Ac-2983 TaxID=3004137 RepID=UPI0022AB8251|nr:glycosyltransferase [Modestobacter sp. VKM Ac-2983]MCZ2803686.1 glycosyltransferase [Modestobacter sp. VKM Ac-2983]
MTVDRDADDGTAVAGEAEDFVFTFAFDTWGDAVARGMSRPPERLVTTMMGHPRVRRLLVTNPLRSAPVRALRTVLRFGEPPFPASDRHTLLTPLRLRREDPTDVPRLVATYRHYDRVLGSAAAARGLVDPVLITTNPFVAAFAPAEWARRVVFYARDDWSQLPARRRWWPGYRAAYREIAVNGRSIMAVSPQIIERISPSGPSLVVPNGIDAGEWQGPTPAAPDWFTAVPGPRAVYAGTLDSRIDVAGLQRMMEAHPELQLFLIGHVPDPALLEPLVRSPRVHVTGLVDRAGIVSVLRNADVCLIAHRRTRLTEAMSPLKLYEYLAAGCPVLTPALGPVQDISPHVLLTEDVAGFADRLPEALARGRMDEEQRQSFVAANAWTARHEQMLDFCLD